MQHMQIIAGVILINVGMHAYIYSVLYVRLCAGLFPL